MRRLFLVFVLALLAPVLAFAQTISPGMGLYPEDSTHISSQYGIFPLAVRRAIGSGLCGADGRYCSMQVDANGALHVVFTNTALTITPTLVTTANNDGSCVSVTSASTTVLASFATRRWASFQNRGTVIVYVKFGATATTADFPVDPGGVFNWPNGVSYTGVVDAISASGTNSVCPVEW